MYVPGNPHREEPPLRSGERVGVIGDVHGCVVELVALVKKLKAQGVSRIYTVGDLVGKGPCSLEVLTYCMEQNIHNVLGNHDEIVLRSIKGLEPTKELTGTHLELAQALQLEENKEKLLWMETDLCLSRTLPCHSAFADHAKFAICEHSAFPSTVVMVHAGLDRRVGLLEQNPADVISMRNIVDDEPSKEQGGDAWAADWQGPELVLFGHDAVRGLQQEPYAIGLDTGCVYGRELTAVILPELEFVSVPATTVYSQPTIKLEKNESGH